MNPKIEEVHHNHICDPRLKQRPSDYTKGKFNPMKRPKLSHPSRAILVHIPTVALEQLDLAARSTQTSRSELIRQRIMEATKDIASTNAEQPSKPSTTVKPLRKEKN